MQKLYQFYFEFPENISGLITPADSPYGGFQPFTNQDFLSNQNSLFDISSPNLKKLTSLYYPGKSLGAMHLFSK